MEWKNSKDRNSVLKDLLDIFPMQASCRKPQNSHERVTPVCRFTIRPTCPSSRGRHSLALWETQLSARWLLPNSIWSRTHTISIALRVTLRSFLGNTFIVEDFSPIRFSSSRHHISEYSTHLIINIEKWRNLEWK